jgi:hypothetical protein
VVEGVSGIVEGLNPKLVRMKLEAFRAAPAEKKDAKRAPQPAAAREPAGA